MSDPNHFIEGVYNYCDRWCARCPLSARCRLYALEQQLDATGPDVDAAAFWAALGMVTPSDSEFADSELEDDDLDFGFDPDEPELLPHDLLSEAMEREKQAHEHPLVEAATRYATDVGVWLVDHADQAGPRADGTPIAPADAVAIVSWYATMIGAKLARAVSARLELEEEHSWETGSDWRGEAEETAEAAESASDDETAGSAKVALLGIERSLGAWTLLRDVFPDRDMEIVAFQKRLGRLRRQVDAAYPRARTFVRPGFDDDTHDA